MLSGVLSSLENFQCLALGVSGLCHSVYVWPAGAANAKTHKKKSQPTDHPTITEQIQLGVVSIVKLSSALSAPLLHCLIHSFLVLQCLQYYAFFSPFASSCELSTPLIIINAMSEYIVLFFLFFINLLGEKAMTCPHVNH